MKQVFLALGALGLVCTLASGACSSNSSSSGSSSPSFCADACPHWITCAKPSVCNPRDLEPACESKCQQAADELGDSEAAFLTCASCVLSYVGDGICNQANDTSVGNVSCTNSCSGSQVGPAQELFFSTFSSDFNSLTSTLCPCGEVQCSGTCKNLQTDAANCGACGTKCGAGEICTNGSCGCTSNQSSCNGSCKNLSTDRNNCGACGHVCANNEGCLGGACQCSMAALDTTHCPSASGQYFCAGGPCGGTCWAMPVDCNSQKQCSNTCNACSACGKTVNCSSTCE
jgi:hypothetical protein